MMPAPWPASRPRTLLSRDRGEIARTLLDHLQDEEATRDLLDFAELEGDAQTPRARVTFDGETWTLDMFGPPAPLPGTPAEGAA